jgi:hypothetical protein
VDFDALRKRYVRLYGEHPAVPAHLSEIEARLGLTLPQDLRRIAEFFDGYGFDTLPLYSLTTENRSWTVLYHTLQLRSAVALPQHFVALAEQPESIIVMNCAEGGRVLWIDGAYARGLATNAPLDKHEEWPSFVEFFAYLLDEEEADRERSGNRKPS